MIENVQEFGRLRHSNSLSLRSGTQKGGRQRRISNIQQGISNNQVNGGRPVISYQLPEDDLTATAKASLRDKPKRRRAAATADSFAMRQASAPFDFASFDALRLLRIYDRIYDRVIRQGKPCHSTCRIVAIGGDGW